MTGPRVTDASDELGGVPPAKVKMTAWRVVSWLLSIAVTIAIFALLFPKLTEGGDVKGELAAVSTATWGVVMVAGLLKIVSDQPQYLVLLPGLRMRESFVSNLAPTAMSNTFPAGSALSIGLTYAMEMSWGFRVRDITRSSVIGGVFTTFVKLGMLVSAGLLLVAFGDSNTAIDVGTGVATIIFAAAVWLFVLVLRSEASARRVGHIGERIANPVLHLVRKPPMHGWDDLMAAFRDDTARLVTERWVMITATQVLPKVTTALVLLLSLRLVGVPADEVGLLTVWVAYVATTIATMIPVTPGGLGVTEAVLVAVLGAGQDPQVVAEITAAVVVFRAATWLLPIVLGAPCFLFWRANRSWRRTTVERYGAGAVA